METAHLQHDPLLDEPGTSSMPRSRLQMEEDARSARVQAQAEGEDEIDLLDLLIVLAKRKRLILGVTLASGVVAAIVSLLLPNRYTATTKILPPQQSQSASTMLLNQLAGGGMGPLAALAGGSLGIKNPSDIYIGILKS